MPEASERGAGSATTDDHINDPQQGPAQMCLFNTVELLENVLRFLSPEDLLNTISVCQAFKDVIQVSPTLQRTLFLKPAPLKQWAVAYYPGHGRTLHAGPTATKLLNFGNVTWSYPYAYNPLLFKKVKEDDLGLAYIAWISHSPGGYFDIAAKRPGALHDIPADAACRAMFLTQPPCKEITINLVGRGTRRWVPVGRCVLANQNGVTIGGLLEVMRRERMKHSVSVDARMGYFAITNGLRVSVEQMEFVERAGVLYENDDPWNKDGRSWHKA